MDLLARREHSRRELQGKLLQRGFEPGLIEQVIAELAAEGLQSDLRFAEAYLQQRYERGYGPLRIRQELQQRGITEDLLEDGLQAYAEAWSARAWQVRCKRFGDELPGDLRERARQSRFLQYRGFSGAQIRRALDGKQNDD